MILSRASMAQATDNVSQRLRSSMDSGVAARGIPPNGPPPPTWLFAAEPEAHADVGGAAERGEA